MGSEIRRIAKDRIEIIKPMWEELNRLHLKESPYFKEHYRTFTFEERCKKFTRMDEKDLLILVAQTEGQLSGYCVSTIEKGAGEIDSLFVNQWCRGQGIGKELVKRSIGWFEENACERIGVSVAVGHESALGFYRIFGFYPRLTYLQMKSDQ
ncbi:MAG: GNAT family N-acetyltransferase [Chitinispirillaceae bacterium]